MIATWSPAIARHVRQPGGREPVANLRRELAAIGDEQRFDERRVATETCDRSREPPRLASAAEGVRRAATRHGRVLHLKAAIRCATRRRPRSTVAPRRRVTMLDGDGRELRAGHEAAAHDTRPARAVVDDDARPLDAGGRRSASRVSRVPRALQRRRRSANAANATPADRRVRATDARQRLATAPHEQQRIGETRRGGRRGTHASAKATSGIASTFASRAA